MCICHHAIKKACQRNLSQKLMTGVRHPGLFSLEGCIEKRLGGEHQWRTRILLVDHGVTQQSLDTRSRQQSRPEFSLLSGRQTVRKLISMGVAEPMP